MDLLAFISGACVALVAVFAIRKYRSKSGPPLLLENELNRLQARVATLTEPPPHADSFREKRADFIASFYATLVSLHRHLHEAHVLQTSEGRLYFGGREASERDVEQKLEREKAALIDEAQKLIELFARHRIYYDQAMIQRVGELCDSLQQMMSESLTPNWLRRGSGAPLTPILGLVAKTMEDVEAAFKKLIGLDETASPGNKRH